MYLVVICFLVQLGHEFNRIMRCDVVSHISTTWKALYAKIIAVGRQEAVESYNIHELLSDLPSDMPEGKTVMAIQCECLGNMGV